MFKWILSAVATVTLGLAVATQDVQASPQYVVAPQYSGYYYAPTYGYYYNPGYVYYPRMSYYYPSYYYSPYVYTPYRTYWYGGYRPWYGGGVWWR